MPQFPPPSTCGCVQVARRSALMPIFQEVLELIQPLGAARRIKFQTDFSGANGHHVLTDNQKLKQVLLNLLCNAVKYNRDGGEVGLSCQSAGSGRIRRRSPWLRRDPRQATMRAAKS